MRPDGSLRLGTRGSTLALWQARHVADLLAARTPPTEVHIEVLRTTGDRITDVPLAMIGDRGLFTKEVDDAVLDGRVDFAVHSFKDVPTALPDGLTLAAVLPREDPRDALLVAPGRPRTLDELPAGARVGTSSLRRRALILERRPDLVVEDLRGNLDTRFERVASGDYDAIVLALAGVRRFGREAEVAEVLPVPAWLPAAAQGALALVARADDDDTAHCLHPLNDRRTAGEAAAERALLAELEGGCQVPIGALANTDEGRIELHGLVASLDGTRVIRAEAAGEADDSLGIGRRLASRLVARGAREVLDGIRGREGDVAPPPAP